MGEGGWGEGLVSSFLKNSVESTSFISIKRLQEPEEATPNILQNRYS